MQNEEIKTRIGRKLARARLLSGLSQQQLGEKIGISFQALGKYETGETNIAAANLFEIAEVLNLNVAYFYDIEDDGEIIADKAILRFTTEFERLDENTREAVIQFVKVLGKNNRDEALEMLKRDDVKINPSVTPLSEKISRMENDKH